MIERQKTGPAATGPRGYLETFGAIIRDRRLSHGAFRLWHALRDYTDHASRCFPGQRRLADDIGCKTHSLKAWTEELVAAGWLSVARGEKGEGFVYTVLDGQARLLRQPNPATATQKGNTGDAPSSNTGDASNSNTSDVPKWRRSVARRGDKSKKSN